MPQMEHINGASLIFKPNFLVKNFLLELNADFSMKILDLISHVYLTLFVIMLPKCMKYFTFSGFCLSVFGKAALRSSLH